MTADILLLCIALGPAVLFYILRVNAVYVYLSLCLGEVLSFFLGSKAATSNLILNNELLNSHFKSSDDIRLGLLLIPVVIVTILMLRTASKKSPLNIFSSLAVGLLAIYLAIPYINIAAVNNLPSSKIWQELVKYQPEIISISAIYILAMLALDRSKLVSHHKSKKHSS